LIWLYYVLGQELQYQHKLEIISLFISIRKFIQISSLNLMSLMKFEAPWGTAQRKRQM